MPPKVSAHIFTLLAAIAGVFQIALVAGAPWGALTQGGRFSGGLPAEARVLATISALLLLAFIHIVRTKAGVRHLARAPRFPRLIWIVVVYCAIGIVANAATPSAAERALWLPVVSVMFITSLHVARRAHAPLLPDGARPYPYVYVNEDGTARELHAEERAYLDTAFPGGDGAQPYIKWRYGSRTPIVRSRAGYLERASLPRKLTVGPAPLNDPFPPQTLEQVREQLIRDGHTIVDNPDGSFSTTYTGHRG